MGMMMGISSKAKRHVFTAVELWVFAFFSDFFAALICFLGFLVEFGLSSQSCIITRHMLDGWCGKREDIHCTLIYDSVITFTCHDPKSKKVLCFHSAYIYQSAVRCYRTTIFTDSHKANKQYFLIRANWHYQCIAYENIP